MPIVVLQDLDEKTRLEKLNALRRGDVVWVRLKGDGMELRGDHPAVIVSRDGIWSDAGTVLVVPFSTHTGGAKPKEYEVPIKKEESGLDKDSFAVPCKVRPVDPRQRVTKIAGRLSSSTMNEIAEQIADDVGCLFDDEDAED